MSAGPVGSPAPTPTPPVCFRHRDRETWISCQRCGRPICPDCMHSASVGYQCPECVREGARSTRQARTPYGGQRVSNPMLTTVVLIGLNVAVWLAIMATGAGASRLVQTLAMLPSGFVHTNPDGTTVVVRGVADGAWWQVLTQAFTHVQVLHIGFNMVALYFLGPMLESMLGRARFLGVYFGSLMTGSAAVMVFSDPHTQTLGASGAIFGLMGTLAVVALRIGGQARQVLVWIGINLVLTFSVSGISWQGHLGGLAGGVVIGAAMVLPPRGVRTAVQWATVGVLVVVSVAVIALRAASLG